MVWHVLKSLTADSEKHAPGLKGLLGGQRLIFCRTGECSPDWPGLSTPLAVWFLW